MVVETKNGLTLAPRCTISIQSHFGAIPRMRARDQGDTVQLSKVRIKESLRALLQKEAEAQQTTLNAIIADRLQRSFDIDNDIYGGPRVAALFRTLASFIESHRDETWLDDADLFNEIVDRWARHFDLIRPRRAPSDEARIAGEFEEFKGLLQANPGSVTLRQMAQRMSEMPAMDPEWRARWAALAEPKEGGGEK
jgi:hypothetical protein